MQTEHEGHTITVTEDFRFKIEGPLFTKENLSHRGSWTNSFGEAKERIDTAAKAHASQNRVKLSIPVLLQNGSKSTVTGIHGGHLKALGVGSEDYVYAPTDKIAALLTEAVAIRNRLKQIEALLRPVKVSTAADYASRSHEEAVKSFQERMATAVLAAEKIQ